MMLWCYCLGSEIRISATATLSLNFLLLKSLLSHMTSWSHTLIIFKYHLFFTEQQFKRKAQDLLSLKKKHLEPKRAWRLLLGCNSMSMCGSHRCPAHAQCECREWSNAANATSVPEARAQYRALASRAGEYSNFYFFPGNHRRQPAGNGSQAAGLESR